MLSSMNKLFKFDYVSPFELETCKERLTPKFKESYKRQGLLSKESLFGWNTNIVFDRKADVTIETSFTQVYCQQPYDFACFRPLKLQAPEYRKGWFCSK